MGGVAVWLPTQRFVHAEVSLARRQRTLLCLLLLVLCHDRRRGDCPVPAQSPAILPLRVGGLVLVLYLLHDLHHLARDWASGILSPGGGLCAAGGNPTAGRHRRLSRSCSSWA